MKKLREQGGYSLSEALSVIVIVLLISVVMASTVRYAADTFTRSVSLSEAQVLCSTLKTVVSDELRNTGTVYVGADGSVRGIFSVHYGMGSGGEMSSFAAVDPNGQTAEWGEITLGGERMLSSTAYTYGAKASVALEYTAEAGCFTATLTVYDRQNREIKTMRFDVMPVKKPQVVLTA